jgi:hypothetical protein
LPGFDVERNERCLILTRRPSAAHWWRACGLVGGAIAVVTLLGILAVVREIGSAEPRGVIEPALGSLWMLGVLVVAVLIPAYAARALIAPTVICFDRDRDVVTHRGRTVAALRRIDGLCVRRTFDPDRRTVYTLAILHTDDCEHVVERSYDEVAVWILAHEIADFLNVNVGEA